MKSILYFDFFGTIYDGTRIPPSMIDVIRELSKSSTLVIVSSAGTSYIRAIVEREGIANHFLHIMGGDTGGSKSDKMIAVGVTDAVMITDTAGDIREAKKAGVRAIGVTWGSDAAEDLLVAGADALASDVKDLAGLLAK